jgi:tRNA(adenine34) deaminase
MDSFMDLALAEAARAAAAGEVPVGAVLVDGATREVIASAHNRVEAEGDPLAHAELLVLKAGIDARGGRLQGCDLYVTLEPCAMCAGAIAHARIRRLYYGADDPKGGGVAHGARVFAQATCHHKPEVYGGIGAEPAAKLLRDFFLVRR